MVYIYICGLYLCSLYYVHVRLYMFVGLCVVTRRRRFYNASCVCDCVFVCVMQFYLKSVAVGSFAK